MSNVILEIISNISSNQKIIQLKKGARKYNLWLYDNIISNSHIQSIESLDYDKLFNNDNQYSKFLFKNEVILNNLFNNPTDLSEYIEKLVFNIFHLNIIIIFSCVLTAITNGKRIYINSSLLNNDGLDIYTRMDLILGFVFHEVGHCLYTDLNNILCVLDEAIGLDDKIQIKKALNNILEDDRIEQKLIHDFPGIGKFIETVKYFMFSYNYKTTMKTLIENNHITKVLNLFFLHIRYPKHLHLRKDITYAIECLNDMKDIYERELGQYYKAGVFLTSQDISHVTNILVDYIYHEGEPVNVDIINEMGNLSSMYTSNKSEILTSKNIIDLYDYILNDITSIYKFKDDTLELNYFACKELYDVIVRNANEYIHKFCTLIPKINQKHKLIYNQKTLQYQTSGKLNTNKLVETIQNVKPVYDQQIITKNDDNDKLVIIINVDISISIKETQQWCFLYYIVMLMETALRTNNIRVIVYSYNTEITKLADSEKPETLKNITKIVNCWGDQNDITPFAYILDNEKNITSNKIIYITMGDGCYVQDVSDIKYAKNKAEREYNASCYSLSVNNKLPQNEQYIYGSKHMLFYYWEFTYDFNKISNELFLFIKKIILEY